jgi:dihydrofolate reductase
MTTIKHPAFKNIPDFMTSKTPLISAIVARGRNNIIGVKGDLPWHLRSDLQNFKAVTKGKPVIMGRKTWESLPFKPLPGRLNIVVTRQIGYLAKGGAVVPNIDLAIEMGAAQASQDEVEEVFVIGGAQIYGAVMQQTTRLYITEVDIAPEGDASFPTFDVAEWTEISSKVYEAGAHDDHAFVVRILDRI